MCRLIESYEKGFIDGIKDGERYDSLGITAILFDLFLHRCYYNPDGTIAYEEGYKNGLDYYWKNRTK